MTDILTRMRRERRLALVVFLLLVAVAVLAGVIAPHSPGESGVPPHAVVPGE
jgi:uncharacterized protein involved in exopolysaccharide biosynthesis